MPTNKVLFQGQKVKDATKRIVVEVSRQDISAGRTKAPDACAAAKACLRQVPKCTQARVFKSRTYLKIGEQWLRFQTPASMRLEIAAFDRGTNFLPGVYVLYPISPSHRKDGKHYSGTRHKKGVTKRNKNPVKRISPHRLEGVREFSLD